jgi:hypothetical protein
VTCHFWHRLGYESLVLLVGEEWRTRPDLLFIHEALAGSETWPVFPRHYLPMGLAQMSRLFVSSEIFEDDRFLVTSDADLWPISREFYASPQKGSVLITNSECCGSFTHNNSQYKMYAIGTIGATASQWYDIMGLEIYKAGNFSGMVHDAVEREFGPEAANRKSSVKADKWWDMDQQLVSIRLAQWKGRIEERPWRGHRLDRSAWASSITRDHALAATDAHVPFYSRGSWPQLKMVFEHILEPSVTQSLVEYFTKLETL